MGEDVKHKVLTERKEEWTTVNSRHIVPPALHRLSSFYLVVKGSVGRFLHRRLFLLIAHLDHHAGVDVFSHQLSGLCDVNGNLLVQVKVNPVVLPTEDLL